MISCSAEISKDVNELISKLSQECLKQNKHFTIAYSGGSLPLILSKEFHHENTSHWRVFYADERCVALDSTDSNHHTCASQNIVKGQVFTIDPSLNPKEAAKDYTQKMKSVFSSHSWPDFDLILLGMGPDGHTCSLFPNHPLLNADKEWIEAITDSPKPPSSRITFTFPVLNHAKNVAIVTTGSGKADVLHRILDLKEDFPVGRVQPIHGNLYWFLDADAASKLQSVMQ
jgi:6-phosphogluconolactonase